MKTLHSIILFPLLLLASCASDKKEPAATPPRKSLSERMNEKNGYKQDSEGNWKAQSDRRSPYEGKSDVYDSQKSFKKSAYKTGDFAKKSWWGNKEYDRKSYEGNTDGSRFRKSSPLQQESARESGDKANIAGPYKTDDYATSTAREAGTRSISKPADAAVESRQKVFKQPEIIDWKEQRSLSLDQSKGILGH